MKGVLKSLLDRNSRVRLAALTAVLAALWAFHPRGLSNEEERLLHRVRAAQSYLWNEIGAMGLERDEESDPHRSGFIGLEWSETTTTLGDIKAKRCAANPLWAVQALRWFDEAGLTRGDRVAVFASSSFPGMLYNVLAAAESRGLRVSLGVSLGSSNWGANRPEAPWPVLANILQRGGYLRTRPELCTVGGVDENGRNLPDDARAALIAVARENGYDPVDNRTWQETVNMRMDIVRGGGGLPPAKLVVSIGGSIGCLGDDMAVLSVRPGLSRPDGRKFGSGVIGRALDEGFPVLHLLAMRVLADRYGVSWESWDDGFARGGAAAPAVGLLLFALVLITHKRWKFEDGEESI